MYPGEREKKEGQRKTGRQIEINREREKRQG